MARHVCYKEAELASMKKDIEYMKAKLDDVHKSVVGEEGKSGLATRVSNIETTGKISLTILGILIAIIGFFKK